MTEPYVHGRGHRKSELQRDIEQLRELETKKVKYAAYQDTFNGRNSFSKTDPDATFMHMKEDHMRNAQLKPGYNIQFGIEGEYITGVTVSSERSDQLTLIPFMEKLKDKGIEYADVTADAGYESEENYSYFEGISTDCYIKPQNYERSKTKSIRATWRFGRTWPTTRNWMSTPVRPVGSFAPNTREYRKQRVGISGK